MHTLTGIAPAEYAHRRRQLMGAVLHQFPGLEEPPASNRVPA